MRRPFILATLLGVLMGAPAMAQASDPAALGASFCQMRADGSEGQVRSLLTKSLLEAIAAAEAASAKYEAANPGDKPPLGDGIPFQSFQDVADSCAPANFSDKEGKVTIDIEYKFKAAPDADYADRIIIKDENGHLLIDDVLYGSDSYNNSLRQVLADIAAGKL